MNDDMFKKVVELARNKYNTIELEHAKSLMEKDEIFLIDVRPSEIYSQAHLPNSINIPLSKLENSKDLPKNMDSQILTICNRGNSSLAGLIILKALGYNRVKSMNGGTLEWINKGYKIEQS